MSRRRETRTLAFESLQSRLTFRTVLSMTWLWSLTVNRANTVIKFLIPYRLFSNGKAPRALHSEDVQLRHSKVSWSSPWYAHSSLLASLLLNLIVINYLDGFALAAYATLGLQLGVLGVLLYELCRPSCLRRRRPPQSRVLTNSSLNLLVVVLF